ncbi:GNAT family N-acetyltransferase [Nocardioides sp.]|uniref:GNAT family N-acetyltransferase n=1 Tax=Nocardioides sp. TaxID=35761 RepID=UPI003519AA68
MSDDALPQLPADLRAEALSGDADPEVVLAWMGAVQRGFTDAHPSATQRDRYQEFLRADEVRVIAVHPDPAPPFHDGMPVATIASWAGRLHAGGAELLPAHLITDVTVSVLHRRRGVLSSLLAADLRHGRQAGRAVALLTSSEGGIYGRFGFGVAVRRQRLTLDTRPGLAWRRGVDDGGQVVLALPATAHPGVVTAFDAYLQHTRGEVARPAFWRPIEDGSFDWDADGPNAKLRTALRLAADGTPDGYATYTIDRKDDVTTLGLHQLLGTPAAERHLWQVLSSIDLVERIEHPRAALDLRLDQQLLDPRRVKVTSVGDHLWLRILDLPAAFAGRAWGADGDVVLEVEDRLDLIAGRWRVTVRDGVATTAPADLEADLEADVRLDAETLGAWFLGDLPAGVLADCDRLEARDAEALARFAAVGDLPSPPRCTTGF